MVHSKYFIRALLLPTLPLKPHAHDCLNHISVVFSDGFPILFQQAAAVGLNNHQKDEKQ